MKRLQHRDNSSDGAHQPVNDLGLSRLGFGAAPLGNEYGDVDEREMARTVHAAIDAGVTFFDTSPYYGRTLSETRLGRAIEDRRDKVVLGTKAGRYGLTAPDGFDFRPDRLRLSVDESLARLRTEYLDVLLLHDIEFSEPAPIIDGAIPVLHELKRQGKARAVGVSSYRIDVLVEVMRAAELDLVLTYCHTDLIDASAVVDLVPIADSLGVAVIAASPLHMGLLTPGEGPPWHPALRGARVRSEVLRASAAELGVSLTDAAISFSLGLPGIASTVAGVSTFAELEQNVAVLRDPVDDSVVQQLRSRIAHIDVEPWPCGSWRVATRSPGENAREPVSSASLDDPSPGLGGP